MIARSAFCFGSSDRLGERAVRIGYNKRIEYFVRTIERHKDSNKVYSAELRFPGLPKAKEEARRIVLESPPSLMLQADACFRNRHQVRTKYRCWINERGEFHEHALV